MIRSRASKEAVAKVFGAELESGGGEAALAFGVRFERALTRDRDGRPAFGLVSSLHRARLIPVRDAAVMVLDPESAGAADSTLSVLRGRAPSDATTIVLGAKLLIPGFGPDAALYPDALVGVIGSSTWVPLEIKAYESRSFLTSQGKIASAAGQAALYGHVLDVELSQVTNTGFLVFRRVGTMMGEAFAVDLRREREAAAAVLDSLQREQLVDVHELPVIPHMYGDSCASVCLLDNVCRSRAMDAGEIRAYGDAVASFVGEYETLNALESFLSRPPTSDETAFDLYIRHAMSQADSLIEAAR
jgi:hypothetical protein